MSPKKLVSKIVDVKKVFQYARATTGIDGMATNPRKYVQTKGPTKTFQKDGHWIEKTQVTPILVCVCGNRYIKTRHGQTKCLRCISQGKK